MPGNARRQSVLVCCWLLAALACEAEPGPQGLVADAPPGQQGPATDLPPGQQYLRGQQYLEGVRVPRDDAEGARWLRRAAQAGHAEAQRALGLLYDAGRGVPEDPAEAVRWLTAAAEQDDAQAAVALALHHADARGTPADEAAARHWLLRAAELGNPRALAELGSRSFQPGEGRDPVQAHAWFNLAAGVGARVARQARDHVEKELTREEVAEAQSRAREWHRAHLRRRPLAARDDEERYDAGVAWAEGDGVPVSEAAALEWLLPAAEAGHPAAQLRVALLLGESRALPPDPEASLHWLRSAARAGETSAARRLAARHRDGVDTAADPLRAWAWLEAAASVGDREAARERDALAATLSPAELEQARRIAAAAGIRLRGPWRFQILGPNGRPTPARVSLETQSGRPLYPEGVRAHVDLFGVPYFYTAGRFELPGSLEKVWIRVQKGFEHALVEQVLERGGDTTLIGLERVFDMAARGYYSGDGHIHANYGLPGTHLDDRELVFRMEAEDLNLANVLALNTPGGEIRLGGRVDGVPATASTANRVLQVSEEYRSRVYGHMSVYGVKRLSDPLFTAVAGTAHPYDHPTNYEAARIYAEQGAFPAFAHLRPPPGLANEGARDFYALECPTDVALGVLNAIEIQGYAVTADNARPVWERLMSAGFDVVISAGTDAFMGDPRAGVMGFARSYVDLEGRPLGYDAFAEQLARGRGFTTNGPLLLVSVDGKRPGETLQLAPGETRSVEVDLRVASVFPWTRAVVRSNGEERLAFESDPAHPRRQSFRGTLELDGPAWIYARVTGPPVSDPEREGAKQPQLTDAFSNPIWVTRGDEKRRDAASIEYFLRWIDENLAVLELRDNYGSPTNRLEVRETFLRARREFEKRLGEARSEASAGVRAGAEPGQAGREHPPDPLAARQIDPAGIELQPDTGSRGLEG